MNRKSNVSIVSNKATKKTPKETPKKTISMKELSAFDEGLMLYEQIQGRAKIASVMMASVEVMWEDALEVCNNCDSDYPEVWDDAVTLVKLILERGMKIVAEAPLMNITAEE